MLNPYPGLFNPELYHLHISEKDLPDILRHGIEHHLYNGFRRSDVVGQDPFLCHADRAHTIKPDAVSKLGVEEIAAQLFFREVRIALCKVFHHIVPEGILGGIFIGPLVKQDLLFHPVHPCAFTKKRGDSYVPRKGMEPFFVMRSFQMGQYTGLTKGGTRIDQRWGKNDGRVNTISEISPFGAPRKHLEPDNLKPGIWNVYPVYKGDHMSLQGGLLHKKNIRSFYADMLTMISAVN